MKPPWMCEKHHLKVIQVTDLFIVQEYLMQCQHCGVLAKVDRVWLRRELTRSWL